mmetsp:Transcript_84660/g.202926  ORF Transcript_84660/g.202926 Transcript_84660/m.202926 type:complete len:451 (+) Transcript_84660:39-1391(+)
MSSRQPNQPALAASEEDAAENVERRAARSLKKSASAPAPTAPILPVKRSSRTRWTPLFRDPTFGGSIGHSGDHRKAKPTLKPSRFVFEDEAELLLTNDGRQRTGEAMSDRLQAVWKIVVQEEEEKPDSPPTPSLLDVFAPPDSALPRIDASSARKISRLSTGSAFSNISSMSRQSSTGAVPQLVSRTASDDPVAHRPSQDSRTSSLVDSKESKGSGSVRASSKLSRDSHPRAPRPLRDIVRRTTPMESDLIVLGSEASLATSPWASEDLTSLSGRSPKGTPRGSPKGSSKLAKLGSVSSLSPKPQARGLPSESKLSLPRTDSRLMRDKEEQRSPKPLDRASTGDLRGKSPRAEKTLLQMELQLKSESKSHKALPGIHRKPSREASGELPGSRPQSRAASKQSESLDGTLLAERRTPSKGVLEQSAGNLLPKQTMKGQQGEPAAAASELLS